MKTTDMAPAAKFVPTLISKVLNKAFGGVGNWLGKPPKSKRAPRDAGRKPYLLEQMEPRLLLSGSASVDAQGLLTVRGDDGINDIRIEQLAQSADASSGTFRITFAG
ncbi:MAG TPA: LEPR-XLL domain-containing protein, partial [Rubrivivax sp.]|nr:LEPR-XLL domain-containing protein [Rubrivivax sp.]